MGQKTIKEWLETLPEPHRTMALENANSRKLSLLLPSLGFAIFSAFQWDTSPQGGDFWESIYNSAERGEFDLVNDAVNDTVNGAAKDKQIGGSHYKDMAIQPSEFIRANNIGWYEANAIKYICRHQSKGGKQDIEKAIHYLEMIIQEYDSNTRN